MKKRFKRILSIVLIIAIITGSLTVYFKFTKQAAAETIDQTENGSPNSEGNSGDGSDNKSQAVLSPSVKMITGDDAAAVNSAITGIKCSNLGLYLDIAAGTPLDNLGVGDVFYLEGSGTTPLGETYIGKISSVDEDGATKKYIMEAPTTDEVFDKLTFDYSQVMNNDNISQITTVDGVTATKTNNVESDFTNLSSNNSVKASISDLTTRNTESNVIQTDQANGKTDGLLFDINIDLLKIFNLKSESEFFEKYSAAEMNDVKVYTTTTGMCYHRDTCPCVGRSKFEMSLGEAVSEGYEPCYLCNPPVSEEAFSSHLNLEGKVGLENLSFQADCDYDISKPRKFQTLSLSANGDYLAEAKLKANFNLELSGQTTEISLPNNLVKLSGLKEKVFPIAFIGYNGSFETSILGGNQSIRTLTGTVPLTVGAIVYMDIDGNISIGTTAYISYKQSFNCDCEIVKDGEWVWNANYNQEDPIIDIGIDNELSGDIDGCLGVSMSLYIFNVNIVDLAVAKIGGEAQGNIKLSWQKGSNTNAGNELSGQFYARLYLKLFDINVKLKVSALSSLSAEIEYNKTLKDTTLVEWGTPLLTRYSKGTMSYTNVTAQDEDADYYKDTGGNLIKEKNGNRITLYDKGFFSICGIDESYLYLLKYADDKGYEIYRVSKNDGTNKKIVENVAMCLMNDEDNLYYVADSDSKTIRRVNRGTLKEDSFASLKEDVKFMGAQGEDFYVVTNSGGFLAFFGIGTTYACLLDANGNTVHDYGSDFTVEDYYQEDLSDFSIDDTFDSGEKYNTAAKMLSGANLDNRAVAQEMYWESADKSQKILTESVSGWSQKTTGIFTTLENGADSSYKIVLYRAADGQRVDVTDVSSDQAFFTLCQNANGKWYFFDQTDSQLVLYSMNQDFSNKTVVKSFTLSEMPCDMKKCSMTLMDNRLYFYTMPDNKTCNVLYRYDLT